MIKRGQNKGFTVVELLIVIICVAILATLVALSYGKVQSQARNIEIRDAAHKFADTIKLMQIRNNAFPNGGTGSTGSASATTGCANGANGMQAAGYSGISCTIGDATVAMGLLPASFFTELPPNTEYGSTPQQLFAVYLCGTKNYLFYWQEGTATAAYSSAAATCAAGFQTDLSTYKMKDVIDLTKY